MIARAAAALALAAGLAGCAGLQRIDSGPPEAGYTEDKARAVTGGLQRVEIAGAPPDGADPATVAAALRAPGRFPPTRFEPAAPGGGGLRLVLEFGRPRASARACETPQGEAQAAGPMVVTAIFCQGDRSLNAATLTAPDLAGPSSPGFSNAMATLLAKLYPVVTKRFAFMRDAD